MKEHRLHDGDTFSLRSGPHHNKLHCEFLNTQGRIGFRVTDRIGRGILFEHADIAEMHRLFGLALRQFEVPSGH